MFCGDTTRFNIAGLREHFRDHHSELTPTFQVEAGNKRSLAGMKFKSAAREEAFDKEVHGKADVQSTSTTSKRHHIREDRQERAR